MAKTLLQAVNEVLRRAGTLGSSDLTSLTGNAIQRQVDDAVQAINTAMVEGFRLAQEAKPCGTGEGQVTLRANTRDYDLEDDVVALRWPLIDQTNNRTIHEYPGGPEALRRDYLNPADHTGLPSFAVINLEDGRLRMDLTPTSNEDGAVYKYIYDRDLDVRNAGDLLPFDNSAFYAFVDVAAELWKRDNGRSFSEDMMDRRLATAMQGVLKKVPARKW